ncbi:MAG: hypothetical protein KDD22_00680 [Bdellovibrionales bacterium]|nr:hypothetical protein [Bdellovibrionales bacterium]
MYGKIKMSWERPLQSERGFAVMILIVVVSLIAISYTLYSANYFLILTSEVKRNKRSVQGLALLQQLGQKLVLPTQRGFATTLGTNNCLDQAPYTQQVHELCLIPAPNQVCVDNPFLNPPQVCFQGAGIPANNQLNVIEVSLREKSEIPEFFRPIVRGTQRLNYFIGKAVVERILPESNMAHAYTDQDLPALVGIPVINRGQPVANCNAAVGPLSPTCIRCRNNNWGGGTQRPQCFTLKVCVLPDNFNGPGVDCDPNVYGQWFWQMIAVTDIAP